MQSTSPFKTGQHIALIGLMGCGKTTVGMDICKRRHLPLMDTDFVIEEKRGLSINEIFTQFGEPYFRQLETHLLQHIASNPAPAHVISTGGGIVVCEENRHLLRNLGFVVWLNVGLDDLFSRVSRCKTRPLLQTPDPYGTLGSLLEQRAPWYEETAHYILDASKMSARAIGESIYLEAKKFFHSV